MLVGFWLAAARGVQMVYLHVKHFGDRVATTLEQTMADAAEEANAGKKAEGGND